jgi:hypothetical protein
MDEIQERADDIRVQFVVSDEGAVRDVTSITSLSVATQATVGDLVQADLDSGVSTTAFTALFEYNAAS